MKIIYKSIQLVINIVLILLMLLIIYLKAQSISNPNETPSIFGYRILTVLTGSMKPALNPGDLVLLKTSSPKDVKVGDIITYQMNQTTLVTHRITRVENINNNLFFRTKGDYNNTEDLKIVSQEQLLGRIILRIPKAGYITHFVKMPLGLILFILTPFLLLVISESKPLFQHNKTQLNKKLSNKTIDYNNRLKP